jgi:multiple antibiotic resistance protein
MHWSEYTRFSVSLFVLLAPFLQVPLMLSLVGEANRATIMRTATVAAATALAILLGAHFAGELILTALGTSVASFQVGGGLVVLLIGLALIQGKPLDTEPERSSEGRATPSSLALRLGVTPLGTPAIAGAGTITAVILETHDEHGALDDFAVTLIIIGNILLVWAILSCAPAIGRFLGRSGLLVLQRIVGLVVVAIGVEIIVAGLSSHISKLA